MTKKIKVVSKKRPTLTEVSIKGAEMQSAPLRALAKKFLYDPEKKRVFPGGIQWSPRLGQRPRSPKDVQGMVGAMLMTTAPISKMGQKEMEAMKLIKQGYKPEQLTDKFDMGTLQKVSQRTRGLGALADLDNAVNKGDWVLADKINKFISNAPKGSPYYAYRGETAYAKMIERGLKKAPTKVPLEKGVKMVSPKIRPKIKIVSPKREWLEEARKRAEEMGGQMTRGASEYIKRLQAEARARFATGK